MSYGSSSYGSAAYGSGVGLSVAPPVLPPDHLALTASPSSAFSGVVFATQPSGTIKDSANGTVAGATNVVTAAITSGSGVLSGVTAVAAVNGVWAFTNLKITGGGNHVIT